MNEFGYEELLTKMKRLDMIAKDRGVFGTIYITGGSALMLHCGDRINKITTDVDVLRSEGDVRDLFSQSVFNTRVQSISHGFSIECIDRAEFAKLPFTTTNINYMVLSLEDVVSSKLYAHRDKDIIDINNEIVASKINWGKLDKIVNEEMKLDSLNDRTYSELKGYYEMYKERWYEEWREEERLR